VNKEKIYAIVMFAWRQGASKSLGELIGTGMRPNAVKQQRVDPANVAPGRKTFRVPQKFLN
jgi:hypothetical protein